ncbi:acetyltransferase (GNAT) family domain-containing protein [Purpureocillium lavendulum]|uniref:Acetyltransferase (GNAT) family domain-containing protein n=1 Tax=Purpureocillium lavendulum TaxID=1247861 RepID=A0AB34G1P7_9HYPO|nr:acetyltransferase (GNAT) family domain-containing protein [Purpureocillium lavendulum]
MPPRLPFRFLTVSIAARLHGRHIAKATPTQPNLLESAVFSPVNHERYGQDDVFQLAGVLAEKIILNHPYQDGNKRTALFAADAFLKANGYILQTKPHGQDDAELDDHLADAHVHVATRRWTAEDLGRYYESIAERVEPAPNDLSGYERS